MGFIVFQNSNINFSMVVPEAFSAVKDIVKFVAAKGVKWKFFVADNKDALGFYIRRKGLIGQTEKYAA